MLNPESVLVTGAAGYIGFILCEHLLDAGYCVIAVDNLMYGQHNLLHLCANLRFEFVYVDVRDEKLMCRLVKGADVLIPLAAIVGAPACDHNPWLARSVEPGEAVQLLNRLRSPSQLVIFPNTNSGYGVKSAMSIVLRTHPWSPSPSMGRLRYRRKRNCSVPIRSTSRKDTLPLGISSAL